MNFFIVYKAKTKKKFKLKLIRLIKNIEYRIKSISSLVKQEIFEFEYMRENFN